LFKNKNKFEQQGLGITLVENGLCNKSNFDAYVKSKRKYLLKHGKQLHYNLVNNNKNVKSEQEILVKLENLLCKYYCVKDFEELGVGSFKNTFDQFNKQIESVNSVIYQDSILDHNFSSNVYENVIEKEQLAQRLSECPLLENVYEKNY